MEDELVFPDPPKRKIGTVSVPSPMAARSFQMLMDAYIRGYHWRGENPDSDEYLHKAAYDYADKNTCPGTSLDMLANQAAHVRLGMKTRQDVTEATKILIDMVEEFVDGKAE